MKVSFWKNNLDKKRKKRLSPFEKVRNALIANRLNIEEKEAEVICSALPKELADLLSLNENAVTMTSEISGRNLDLLFTINKQNKPRKI